MASRRPQSRRLANGQTRESAFGGDVERIAAFYGWRVYHTHRSDRSPAGFPDYVLVRPPELIFAEIKPDEGAPRVSHAVARARDREALRCRDLTDAQAAWLTDLADVAAGVRSALAMGGPGEPEVRGIDALAVDVYLWRPRDWDEIQQRLARGRRIVPASFDPRR